MRTVHRILRSFPGALPVTKWRLFWLLLAANTATGALVWYFELGARLDMAEQLGWPKDPALQRQQASC
jgi:hypothetical protein